MSLVVRWLRSIVLNWRQLLLSVLKCFAVLVFTTIWVFFVIILLIHPELPYIVKCIVFTLVSLAICKSLINL